MPKKLSPIKQKVLLVLLSGVALGLSYSPHRQFKIIKGLTKEWKRIDQQKIRNEIMALYRSKLVDLKQNADKSFTMVLTDKGRMKTMNYHFEKMKIERAPWDGKWRVVIFDIPENLRKGRDGLREKLKSCGFRELQKSVFVLPYPCDNEVDFLIEFFGLREFVRTGILEKIDNDLHLRKIFALT